MNKKSVSFLAGGLCLIGFSGAAYAAPIDLSGWTALGDGNWIVSADSTEVTQTKNGNPTYFLSDNNYLNHKFAGTFHVAQSWDNDFLGFVFGWEDSEHYYLFDWKKEKQFWSSSGEGEAEEGFTLAHISGTDVDYWNHKGDDIDVLATDYGDDKGWENNVVYNFLLDYTETNFTISINGTQIFTQSGNFTSGKFGFYNYSQEKVTYQGFDASQSSPVPEPVSMALFSAGLLLSFSYIRRRNR